MPLQETTVFATARQCSASVTAHAVRPSTSARCCCCCWWEWWRLVLLSMWWGTADLSMWTSLVAVTSQSICIIAMLPTGGCIVSAASTQQTTKIASRYSAGSKRLHHWCQWHRQQQPPFCDHYTGQPALAGTSSEELEDFVGANFYCLHALAGSNQ